MRIVLISDTHGLHNRMGPLPNGDILIHAGDFMNAGYDRNEVMSFNRWLGKQAFKHRLVCAGNHDRLFQRMPDEARSLLTNGVYLEESGLAVEGFSFWGSPYTPKFLNWAFMYPRGDGAKKLWERIPDRLDVLVTHGPPHGILDQTKPGGAHLGCEELLRVVKLRKPRLHIFGHIHGGAGLFCDGTTQFVNAAYLNESYKPVAPAGEVRIVDL